jgi:hypothetical protein
MEHIFSFTTAGNITYDVVFKEEAYHFTPSGNGPAFALRREHDEWRTDDHIEKAVKSEAITALDNYLLQQN